VISFSLFNKFRFHLFRVYLHFFVYSIIENSGFFKFSCSCLHEQVIDETLRLGGIAIWLMREAKEDVQYQGTEF